MLLDLANESFYTCGGYALEFAGIFPKIVSLIISLIQFGIPVILIVLGMMDLGKAVMAQKEDEIKKGQSTFVKSSSSSCILCYFHC